MRYVILFVLTLFFALFNTSFVNYLGILSVLPDIFLVYVVCVGLLDGSITAGLVGLIGGLFIDTTAGSVLGMYTFVYLLIGLLCGIKVRELENDNVLKPLVFTAAATLISGVLIMVITKLSGTYIAFFYGFVRYYLPAILYNCIILEVVYFLLRHLYNLHFMKHGRTDLDILLKK